MVVASPAQTITDLSSINAWIGATDPVIMKWYDQSGSGLHLVNQGTLSKFRLVSDKGDFPAVYITGGGTNFLKVTTSNTVTNLAIVMFADFTYRVGANSYKGGFFSFEKTSVSQYSCIIKNWSASQSLAAVSIGSGYTSSGVTAASVEGRLSAGFSLSPNDIRVYLGRKVVIYNTAQSSIYTYSSGSSLLVGANYDSNNPLPGNELFELILYTQAMSHDQMYNITSNMTFFFDQRGSIPHTNFAPYAVYSIRRVIPTYYGPNLQIRRASDNAIASLYTNLQADYTALAV